MRELCSERVPENTPWNGGWAADRSASLMVATLRPSETSDSSPSEPPSRRQRGAIPAAIAMVLTLAAGGCSGADGTGDDAVSTPADGAASAAAKAASEPVPGGSLPVVPEAWHTEPVPVEPGVEHDIDSLAVWETAPGEAIVLVTAKQGDQIWVHDANTGAQIRRVGGPGRGPGQFERPNGIAVVGDLAIVVERDNARLQLLRLPDLEWVGFVGENELTRPYGIAAFEGPEGIEVFITDNYETEDEEIPPVEELGRRVRHFRLRPAGDGIDAELVNTFGDIAGAGILHKVETIAVDPANDRLLIVDELETELAIRVYALDGNYVETMGGGIFEHEPEGIALFETTDGGGYWLATDQQETLSLFLVFDRASLEYVGGFTGEITANTDGVTLTQLDLAAFPEGAFFAVNADATVTAFDWRQIAAALGF